MLRIINNWYVAISVWLIFGIGLIFIYGCNGGGGDEDTVITLPDVGLSSYINDFSCPTCVGQRLYKIYNNTSKPVEVTLRVTRYVRDEYQELPYKKYKVSAGGDTPAGCRVIGLSGGGACDIKYNKTINNWRYANSDFQENKIDRIVEYTQHENEGSQNYTCPAASKNCEVLCNKDDSDCIKSDHTKQKFAKSLSDFSNLIRDKSITKINKADIMAMFNVKDDPCGRGDTYIKNNSIILNEGKTKCIFGADVNLGDGELSRIDFVMPLKLEGKLLRMGGKTVVYFSNSNTAPLLEIEDVDYHKDWGGKINSVVISNNHVIFETQAGCIEAKYANILASDNIWYHQHASLRIDKQSEL